MESDGSASMRKLTIHSVAERLLDQAIELTFPASDPIAVDNAFASARRRDRTQAVERITIQTRRTKPKRQRS
jgi:hypothetical protein